nr:Os06g0549950 [Ipomoea batatas]
MNQEMEEVDNVINGEQAELVGCHLQGPQNRGQNPCNWSRILWDCWKHKESSKPEASEAMRDASERRLGLLRPIQWRIRGKIGYLPCVDKAFFQHPLENLGGKGAFGIVGLDLEAPLFEIEGAVTVLIQLISVKSDLVTPNSGNPFCIMASKASDLPRYCALNKPSTVLSPVVLGFGNVEYSDGFRHGNQFQFPGEYDAEASPAAAPDSPEEILPHGFTVQDSPVNIHDSGVNHVRGSGLDPRRLLPNVNLDRPELDQVQNGKGEGGNKGNALVIVATASGPELDVILSGANECSSDVGFP